MRTQDDDSMMIVSVEEHRIIRVKCKGACVRVVLKGRALVDISMMIA